MQVPHSPLRSSDNIGLIGIRLDVHRWDEEMSERFPPLAGETFGRSGPMVRTIMVRCPCGKHQLVSGHSLNDIEEKAKEKAKERAAEKGWVFSEGKVRCPECRNLGNLGSTKL